MSAVLVTGADGPVGSRLVEALDGEENICVFARCSACNARGRFGTEENEVLSTVDISSVQV